MSYKITDIGKMTINDIEKMMKEKTISDMKSENSVTTIKKKDGTEVRFAVTNLTISRNFTDDLIYDGLFINFKGVIDTIFAVDIDIDIKDIKEIEIDSIIDDNGIDLSSLLENERKQLSLF